MQGAGHDFRGACRAAIEQNDDRLATRHIAAPCIVALRVICVAPTCRDDLAAIHEFIADGNGLIEKATGVVAQVNDEAAQLCRADLLRQVDNGIVEQV